MCEDVWGMECQKGVFTVNPQNIRFTFANTVPLVLVVAFCFGLLLSACKPKQPDEPLKAQEELEGMAKEMIAAMAQGRYEDARKEFDKKMAVAAPASRLEDIWTATISQAGNWEKTARTRFTEEAGYRVVYVASLFEKGSLDIKVVFDNQGKISGMWLGTFESNEYQPPEYANQDLFDEREVVVGEGKWALPGTLSMPAGIAGDALVPAVVLVHGSGPNDRDETIGPNKPFKDLAWGLASKGIAVLRYEKRTKEHAVEFSPDTEEAKNITVKEEAVDDAVLAVRLLKTVEGIDPDRIFVVGHSLGATVGPRIAEACGTVPGVGAAGDGASGSGSEADTEADADTRIAGLVMMAATSRNLVDLIPEQIEYLANLDGHVDETESQQIQEAKAAVERIKSGKMAEGEMVFGAPKAYWDDLAAHDQAGIAKGLALPILILQGERDYQVTMVDLEGWKAALPGKPNVVIKTYPDLNHLFISGTGKSSPAEYAVPSNVSEEVVNDIAKWVKSVAGSR
ncbi:MAG TPA: alpha/beta fold hydrolase [Firmicutes bacterium]|nr:alpha/beta fold hydrolase [Candidatus Fermentithermobacillaceae bacterium]